MKFQVCVELAVKLASGIKYDMPQAAKHFVT